MFYWWDYYWIVDDLKNPSVQGPYETESRLLKGVEQNHCITTVTTGTNWGITERFSQGQRFDSMDLYGRILKEDAFMRGGQPEGYSACFDTGNAAFPWTIALGVDNRVIDKKAYQKAQMISILGLLYQFFTFHS